ncbi:MAG TPA: hypothetical protein VFT72_04180 [Opitutaceae bacterium]|nr:hypothetical protein [Opitutaceae bacterium]
MSSGWFIAYRFIGAVCLAPCLGCLIFLLISYTTGGQWADAIRPRLARASRLLPWIWLALIPGVILEKFPIRHDTSSDAFLRIYLTHTGSIVRAFVYLVVFAGFAWFCRTSRETKSQTAVYHVRGARHPGFGPVGLIVLVFTLHLLAVDWIFALEPKWTSTGFPLVWMAGQAISGLSLTVFLALRADADPARHGAAERALGLDWGNLLLTSTVFWVYVGFLQFLIIWSGDIPREISWYVHRAVAPWPYVLVALAVVHLAIPFFALLSQRLKTSRRGLSAIAAILFCSQIVYTAWMILPSWPNLK